MNTDAKLAEVAWLAGDWIGEEEGVITEEQWTQPRGGTMFGINRMVRDGETMFFEYLCIQHTHEGIFYLASPRGRQPPTPFKMVHQPSHKAQQRAVFENDENDFPSRIVYHRIGSVLHARIEGMRNGQPASQAWMWREVK